MSQAEDEAAEKTYRAIGRFMFEFSQVEYTIRHYLAEEIGLKEEHYSAVVESYEVGVLTTVAIEVFQKSDDDVALILKLLKKFREMNEERKRVAHGLWVPFQNGGKVRYVSRNKLTPSQFTDQAKELEQRANDLCELRAEFEQAYWAMKMKHLRQVTGRRRRHRANQA